MAETTGDLKIEIQKKTTKYIFRRLNRNTRSWKSWKMNNFEKKNKIWKKEKSHRIMNKLNENFNNHNYIRN